MPRDLRKKTSEIGGFVDTGHYAELDKPELRVQIDRAPRADLGVDFINIATDYV
jgi:hypothetical protein